MKWNTDRLLGEWMSVKTVLTSLWDIVSDDIPLILYQWREYRPYVRCKTCREEWLSQWQLREYGECEFCWRRFKRVKVH